MIYAILTSDIGQKVTILTYFQIMTITKFLILVIQKKNFLPMTYLISFQDSDLTLNENGQYNFIRFMMTHFKYHFVLCNIYA